MNDLNVNLDFNGLPYDWDNPEFDNLDLCNEWKRYASDNLKILWSTFDENQKKSIACSLQDIADNEYWD